MRNGIATALALSMMAISATETLASSSDNWAELMLRASDACAKASELREPKTGKPIDFSDKVFVTVDGIWPQPHMKNAPARFLCLYDKRTQEAEAVEAAN